MSVTQTVDIPASRRLVIDVPREVPVGRTILAFTPALEKKSADAGDVAPGNFPTIEEILRGDAPLPGGNARTLEEALQMAAEKAADPNRKPISELFGTHKGFFGGDGVAYQRAIRDEWD